jgi:nucleotide-binding universal stress UspA family protein
MIRSIVVGTDGSPTAELAVERVGNKGMRGAKRFLLGSVPNKVAHHASCDVMIVRTT